MKDRIAVIGAGPSGAAAALQLKRYGFNPILIERDRIGGLAKNAHKIFNYLGFPGGISGRSFIKLLASQLRDFNITVTRADICTLDYNPAGREYLLYGNDYEARVPVVIAAAGTRPVEPGNLSLPRRHARIFYEAYPLLGVSSRHIMVIGAGDAAFDYALNLARKNTVTILNRSSTIKALPSLTREVLGAKAIKYRDHSFLTAVDTGDPHKLILDYVIREKPFCGEFDYLLFGLGRVPNRDFFSPYLRKEEKKLQEERSLYIIGDQANDRFRQVSIAAGDGVRAAMQIYENCRIRGGSACG